MKLFYTLAGCALAQNYCGSNNDDGKKCPDGEFEEKFEKMGVFLGNTIVGLHRLKLLQI